MWWLWRERESVLKGRGSERILRSTPATALQYTNNWRMWVACIQEVPQTMKSTWELTRRGCEGLWHGELRSFKSCRKKGPCRLQSTRTAAVTHSHQTPDFSVRTGKRRVFSPGSKLWAGFKNNKWATRGATPVISKPEVNTAVSRLYYSVGILQLLWEHGQR